jgi:hypothetical protein
MPSPKRPATEELLRELDALESKLPSALAFGEPVRRTGQELDEASSSRRASQYPQRIRSNSKDRSGSR